MPIKPYQTYIVAWVKDTLQSLVETGFYLYSYEIDHQTKQEEIKKAECLWVGEPKQTTDGDKIVGMQYVGKILSRGWLSGHIDENSRKAIITITSSSKLDGLATSQIEKAFKNQLINFHLGVKERWKEEWKFGFFQMEYPNPVATKAFHMQKMNHEMYWNFDASGKLLIEGRSAGRYYHFYEGAAFDIETGRLLKDGEEVLFGAYDADLKSKFLQVLAKAEGAVIEKEEIWKALGLKWEDSEEKNKKLRSLLKILVEYDFGKNLWIDENTTTSSILVCPPRKWYRFVGHFSDEV